MATCLLAVGANVGKRRQIVASAITALNAAPSLAVVRESQIYNTVAVGGPPAQAAFANAAVVVETELPPKDLLQLLQSFELRLGRTRDERWGPRTLDLDLLLCGEDVVESPELVLPHPRLSFRPFVLDPAIEIAADWHHPVLGATLGALHTRLKHGDDVVMLYGGTPSSRQWHADRLISEFTSLELKATGGQLFLRRGTSSPFQEPKLAIQLHKLGENSQPGIPTLRIPSDSREEVAFDTIAALQCVWPDLCPRPSEG